MMNNKRGQGLSTNAIILIVLGVIILVVLIIGFTMGWKTLFPWLGGKGNSQIISNSCKTACVSSNKYAWCDEPRNLTDENGNIVKVGNNEMKDVSCKTLAEKNLIDDCPSITC